jgi:hypothetical protein
MNFAEVARQLSYGELSQLAIGKKIQEAPTLDNLTLLTDSVNLGLTAIYKRFNLKEGTATVPLVVGTQSYTLTDPAILKVEKVLTDLDFPLPLNDEGNIYSCETPSVRVLKLPKVVADQGRDLPDAYKTSNLKVEYRANHPKLVINTMLAAGLSNVELELPDPYFQALLFFVASRFHNPVGMENEFHAGNSYYAKFEAECKMLEGNNLEIDDTPTNNRLQRAGFV